MLLLLGGVGGGGKGHGVAPGFQTTFKHVPTSFKQFQPLRTVKDCIAQFEGQIPQVNTPCMWTPGYDKEQRPKACFY